LEIKYLDHFNIQAPKEQLSKVKEFYIDVLGFKVGFRPKLNGPGQWKRFFGSYRLKMCWRE
jgi:4-hydroxyphenylpyruvate dioxygenase-like putative hemolysin